MQAGARHVHQGALRLVVAALVAAVPVRLHAQSAAADTEHAAVLAVAQRALDAIGTRDTAAARATMLPTAQLHAIPGAGAGSGAPLAPRRSTVDEFVASLGAGTQKFLERIWKPTVLVHGTIAHVWAPYDFHVDGKFSHCGVDSFMLGRVAEEWKIIELAYTVERTGCAPSPLGEPK